MPVMPTWIDYLPERDQLRGVSDEAFAKARKDAASLDGLAKETLAARLTAAAAEAARVMTITPGDAMGIVRPYQSALAGVLPFVEQLADPFGALAFANIVVAHGAYVDDWYDATTKNGFDRERAVLEACARGGRSSRELAYLAIGAGRSDLARALTGDRVVLRLADALDARDAPAFYDFVAAFPEMDATYAELFFAARAFVVVLEERGLDGIRETRRWLHRAVHEGPSPLVKYTPPVPRMPRVPPEMPKVRTGPSPLSWRSIEGSDIHGLWGGYAFAISSIGDIEVIDTMHDHRVRGTLDATTLAALDACIARHHPRSIEVVRNAYAIPDETSASITVVETNGEKSSAWKMASERSEGFAALWGHLMGIARGLLPK